MSRPLLTLLTLGALNIGVLSALPACRTHGETPSNKVSSEERPSKEPRAERPEKKGDDEEGEAKGNGKPLELFIIMDTVRADHLSLCGYDRPTSPYLEKLRDENHFATSCNAHTPGPWTVPSHASYFTGLSVPEHGSDSMGIKFSKDIPTLSEIMAKKGYQPVLLSANPTLSKESGLQRGFEHIRVPRTLTDIRGEDVRRELQKLLQEVDPKKPMFLFVNLIDAHDPYPRVPADLKWVPAQEQVVYDVHDKEQDTPYHKYFKGEMSEERQREYEERARNGYDYGISLVDHNVGEVLRTLKQEGWLKNGFRVVITSDHGEFLGEKHLLRHGCYLWEPVTRVPFLYFDSTAEQQITLPDPLSSGAAFWLISEGHLPGTLPVQSYSNLREFDIKKGSDMAALWLPDQEKLVWDAGTFSRYDLKSDPNETAPQPLAADHPYRAKLESMAADHLKHLATVRNMETDPALMKQLEELGYLHRPDDGTAPE